MFNNKIFEQWLDKKTDEILSKVDREQITTEEMIVLSLKAQSNHFYHIDIENREEFNSIKEQFKDVKKQFEYVDKRFEQVDKRFEQVDKRFDRLEKLGMWAFAMLFTAITGIYFTLFKIYFKV